jgi:predicted PolB exonuclease-like 3'-5' exonuclease
MATDLLPRPTFEIGPKTAYLILDTESVPDGKLLGLIKYPGEHLDPEEAVVRAQAEARERSTTGSDFLPVTFQYPVAVCVVRVANDFSLQAVTQLDAPQFRPREIVKKFWHGVACYKAKLVTFNGRGFDLPLMEMAAFRYGCPGRDYFQNSRNRFNGHVDLCDWMSNYGAARLAGGLDLLSKLLGKPGKMEVSGDQVYAMHLEGKSQEINDYCMFDTIDTYFVFLRTRVLTGDITLEQEYELVQRAKAFLSAKTSELPGLRQYLANWGDWNPWP